MKRTLRFTVCILLCFFVMSMPGWAEERQEGKGSEEKEKPVTLEEITVFGTPYINPVTPINTPFGTQYNLVTEEQIKEQNAYDFQSTLRDVPGVMFQSKNLMGSQTSHSIYVRGRGASHPSSDIVIQYDGVPRFGALFGQVLGDGIAVSTIGGVEVYKSPQPSRFGSGYAMINVLPKYLREEGREVIVDTSAGSHGTFSESLSGGVRQGPFDAYLSQSWASTDGHVDHSRAQQQNYYANMGYQINRIWNVRFLINHVESQTLAPMPEVTPTSTNGVSWPGAERYDTDTTFTTLTVGASERGRQRLPQGLLERHRFRHSSGIEERTALRQRNRRALVPSGDHPERNPGQRGPGAVDGRRNRRRRGHGLDRPGKHPKDLQR